MAEFITKNILNKLDISDEYIVASSATSTEELGNPLYPPAARELLRRGIPFTRREATRLCSDDYDKYDIFALMDDNNMRNIRRIISADPMGKICKLMSFTGSDRDVADPWYTGDFTEAYNDILEGCIALLASIDPRISYDKAMKMLASGSSRLL